LWIGYYLLSIGKVGRGAVVGLVFGFDIPGCVVFEWEEGQGFGLVFGLDIADRVVVELKERQGLVFLWIGYCWLGIGRDG
jgi:hypothetical protein